MVVQAIDEKNQNWYFFNPNTSEATVVYEFSF